MKVVITGSNGYIGQCLLGRIAAKRWEGVGIDLGLFHSSCLPGAHRSTLQTDFRALSEAELSVADVVVHLAAISNDPMGELDERITKAVNLDGTIKLAKMCAEAGVTKFVFMSTCSVYGFVPTGSESDEDGPLSPLTAYARTKLAAERALAQLETDMQIVILRGATAFGASKNPRLDLVVNDFTWNALMRGKVLLRSDGSAHRPLIAADDIAAVIVECIGGSASLPRLATLNVGSRSQIYSIFEVAETVATEIGATIEFAEGAEPDTRNYVVNFDRLTTYFPSTFTFTSLKDGVAGLVDMINQNFDAFSVREQFVRLAQLQRQPHLGGLGV